MVNITRKPDMTGSSSCAWKMDLAAIRTRRGLKPENDGTVALWMIEAPWAHPAWHSYVIVLIHLRPLADKRETKFYLKDATHEIWVIAMHPQADREAYFEGIQCLQGEAKESSIFFIPNNFSSQFIESSDESASARVETAVRDICAGRLSPDTDFIRHWMHLFGDNILKDPKTAGDTKIIIGDKALVIPALRGPQDIH